MLIKILCILLPDINIQLCTNNLLYKELTEWWSEAAGLFQLLIIGACTDAGSKMKGRHTRVTDQCLFV